MGSGASKLKYIVENSSADHVGAALKEQLSQDAVDESDLEGCSSRLIQRIENLQNEQDYGGGQDYPLPTSLHAAETTEQLVMWCRQIQNLQKTHCQKLISWVKKREENGPSLMLLTDAEDWRDSGLPAGGINIVLARLKAEANSPSQDVKGASNMTGAAQAPHTTVAPGASAHHESSSPRSLTSAAEYSLEDPRDLAKFLRTADICFVRAEYFWQLFDQNKVPPARRQELEKDKENKIKNGKIFAEPLVSHDEVDDWASGDEEALLCSISHCWESMEHADFTGNQARTIASATATYAAAYGVPVWVFIDFLSIYQYEQTVEQREKFNLAMQNMHLLYSHESTITLRLEHLTPKELIQECMEDPKSTVKIFYKPSKEEEGQVKEVHVSKLTLNPRKYSVRGWCRTEIQWSCQRSDVRSNQQIDSYLNKDNEEGEESTFKCQVAEEPKQFELHAQKEEIQFMKPEDIGPVLALQKKVFFQKAEKCEHLVVEYVDNTQIAVLALSIKHYKVLKSLTLRNFRCRLPEAEKLCKALAKPHNLEELEKVLILKPADTESQDVIEEAFRSCKVRTKKPNLRLETEAEADSVSVVESEGWRAARCLPEPKICVLVEQLQSGMAFVGDFFDLSDLSEYEQRALLRALKRSMTVKHVRVKLEGMEELRDLKDSRTSVERVSLKKIEGRRTHPEITMDLHSDTFTMLVEGDFLADLANSAQEMRAQLDARWPGMGWLK